MKLRIILISFTLLLLGISNLSHAQKISANHLEHASGESSREAGNDDVADNSRTENTALRSHLLTLFPKATAQQWSENTSGSFVSFLNNGRRASACFSTKGRLNYAITACDLEQLPKELRKTINKRYKAFRLFHATQIMAYGETAYQAILENETGFITLKYSSEGMEEIQQVKK